MVLTGTTFESSHPNGLSAGPGADVIKSIELFKVLPRWLFVRVETSEGNVGWGEATLEGHLEAVEGAFEDLRERFTGWNVDNIEDIYTSAFRHRFYRGGPVLMSAISGLDIALWDIKGRKLGVPIWQLMGGRVRDKVKVYGWIGGDRPTDILEQAKKRKAEGFTTVKMNGSESLGWLASPEDLKATVERLKEVKSIGMDAGLDFHGRVHRPMAKQLARMLEPHQPLFIEEPLLPGQIEELKKLYAQTTIPIALGERLFTRQDFRPYFESGCIDICQPDISHSGGISETRKIALMAETYDIGFAPHCPLGPIAFAASLQLAACTINFVICEMSIAMHYNKGAYDLLTYMTNPEVFKVEGGHVATLEGPGLGIELNEKLIREVAIESKAFYWKNPVWRGEDGSVREW